jgi:catechol 2,3-dioxygenase-like lactoylglutathione lyase family enzyme
MQRFTALKRETPRHPEREGTIHCSGFERAAVDHFWEASTFMSSVSVRYIVDDVDAAVRFYTELLNFRIEMQPAPGFAMLAYGDLRLLLNQPGGGGGGGQAMPDGQLPAPGGWNRFQLEVDDLDAVVERLRAADAHFRNEIVSGRGGKQILLEDPSGNPIELFQPA